MLKEDVEKAYEQFEKRQVGEEEKIRLTRDLLRKVFSAFISKKILSLKDKEPEITVNYIKEVIKHPSDGESLFVMGELLYEGNEYIKKDIQNALLNNVYQNVRAHCECPSIPHSNKPPQAEIPACIIVAHL